MKISRKKLQIGLLLLGFVLIILTYFVYPKTIIEKTEEKKEIELKEKEEVQEDTSFVNVEYKGLTRNGSPYTVKSEYANINEEIDRLRHSATSALLMRDDVIVVSSVSSSRLYRVSAT